MKTLRDAFKRDHVLLDVRARGFPSIFREVVGYLVDQGLIRPDDARRVRGQLVDRQRQSSTAIGHAVAVPHAYLDQVREQIVVFVRLDHPVNLGAPDGIPTRYFFFLLGPPEAAAQHLDTLASVARLMSDDQFRYLMGEAEDSAALLAAQDDFDRRTGSEGEAAEAAERAKPLPDALRFTGRFAGGLRADIRRRLPWYISDFRDGLHTKCLGSILFLFFACLAPTVTFGGVMAVQTENQIGAVEMIIASSICGVIFALLGGQPLLLLGGTGPLLIFTTILYQLCSDLEIPFLPAYAWIGLWSSGFLILLAVTDLSFLMRYFTRFTNDIFSALIAVIFIYEAIRALAVIFQDLDIKQHHDTALLSLLLALGTFFLAINFSRFRKSHYLRPKMREFLADFGPAIAILAMTVLSIRLDEVSLDVLPAPDSFGTTSGRPWLTDLTAVPVWVRFAAIGPAMFVTVLLFLDQHITARIINSPDHRLRKGAGYHLDLAVMGAMVSFCSIFGLPWLVAATVRSLNHVRSLATTEEVVSPGGDTRDRVIFIRENRLTGLAIHVMIGLALLLLPLLKEIPMAVLYGLFLFMGVNSISGNQFFERVSLWVKDPDLYPVTHYIRRVPLKVIHAYTGIQLACLAVLWVVKSSAVGILFPVCIAMLVPVRLLANRFFPARYLAALDAEEEPEDEESDWAG